MANGATERSVVLKTRTGDIEGTLLVPASATPTAAALIIAGSGPTDGDGNNPAMKNNSLKMLAAGLADRNIATLRYDKRGIGRSQAAGLDESELRFENYIEDAKSWIEWLESGGGYPRIVVIGHSEGSLIGMVVAREKSVERFVSISGAGMRADKILRAQLQSQPPIVLEKSDPILDELVKGNTVSDPPRMLYALFRPSVQPYMISWFRYDPQKEIRKIDKPILILHGTTDIQISVEDAKALHAANPESRMEIIEGMNHIMKMAGADRKENLESYADPELPISGELVIRVAEFINS